ncbi:hypothetical protein JOD43_001707 [Pullulanibacillus pueri]|uniref:Uncharacterized protein n=1 Tax=Pullulanibacillus pueri TaxID=1437324 RepID=A0A8J2ZV32_9BACL|nr:hypothetical protein [Pullulanibacillus pueri]MBM7681540.1 hypothetical protein [Pullulanibacillus pueri]GGH79750.1 hypothetical protein GCM10007096_15140 [Pullulanibacillus pueri]
MKGFILRYLVLMVIGVFLYKNRYKLMNILVSIEAIRGLFKLFDGDALADGCRFIKQQWNKSRQTEG